MEKVILCDLSWMMHRNAFSLKMMGIIQSGKTRPTGHVFGTIRDIMALSVFAERVILCVDSKNSKKKALLPSYKEGRPKSEYNIYSDLIPLLKIATQIPNVFYVKVPEMEADDLIASYIKDLPKYDTVPAIFGIDNDLYQTPCPFRVITALNRGMPLYQDTLFYIREKYGIALPYLPVWYQVLKGKASNKVPNLIPRYKADLLTKIVMDNALHQDLNKFKEYLQKIPELWDKYKTLRTGLDTNYKINMPDYISINLIENKKIGTKEEVVLLLEGLKMETLIPSFS